MLGCGAIKLGPVVTFGHWTDPGGWVVGPFGDDSEDWDVAHRWCIAMSHNSSSGATVTLWEWLVGWWDGDPPAVAALPSTTWRCHCWSPLLPLCQCHFLNWGLFLILLALRPRGRYVHQSHIPVQWERGQNTSLEDLVGSNQPAHCTLNTAQTKQQITQSGLQGWSEGDPTESEKSCSPPTKIYSMPNVKTWRWIQEINSASVTNLDDCQISRLGNHIRQCWAPVLQKPFFHTMWHTFYLKYCHRIHMMKVVQESFRKNSS